MATRSVELVVVRHGETLSNRSHIVQGHLDTPLSDLGLQQAECVGKYLKDVTFSHAISSDLSRALQTGQAIVSSNPSLKGKEIEQWTVLRERCFGELEGQGVSVMQEATKNLKGPLLDWGPSGGETGHQFRDRVRQFLTELGKKILTLPPSEDLRLLITSHGGFIKELNMVLVKEYSCEMPCRQGEYGRISPNTGVTKYSLVVDEEGRIARVGCSLLYYKEHLKDLEYHEPVNYGV